MSWCGTVNELPDGRALDRDRSRVASVLLVVATAFFWIAVLLWLMAATNLTIMFWGGGPGAVELGLRVFVNAVLFLVPGLAGSRVRE